MVEAFITVQGEADFELATANGAVGPFVKGHGLRSLRVVSGERVSGGIGWLLQPEHVLLVAPWWRNSDYLALPNKALDYWLAGVKTASITRAVGQLCQDKVLNHSEALR
jgi:hypothetical protein